jgi:hypothetical protein
MDSHNVIQRYAVPAASVKLQMLTAPGHVHIWSYVSQSIVKTFELTDVPVRAGRFIARKNWIVAGTAHSSGCLKEVIDMGRFR